ncbi:response regulator [Tabrizicola sp. WMC-M-20]|nr:response regulator [Tabrizicola sp. WMC-M-20]
MIAFVAIGILVGALSFVTSLFMGASFWFALMLYSLVGAASVIVAAVIPVILGEGRARGAEGQESLPDAAPVSEAVAGVETAAAYLAQGGMRILAVDDDPIILGLIPRIAAEVGCADTTISSSGAQALSLLEQSFRPYDCVLLDINMPGIDGIELCGRIRRIAAYCDTPIIMLTAMKDIEHLDRAFRAGASDYISKPFDVIAFGTCLRNVQDKILLSQIEPAAENAPAIAARKDTDWTVPKPGSIEGIETLIEQAALQNYLVRLSGVALSGAYVLAVGVERNDGMTGPITLAPVVSAISTAFTKQPCVISYVGEGQLIVVSNSVNMPDPSALERAIENELRQQTSAEFGAGVTINVGMAVRPGSNRTLRAKIAIDSALRLSGNRAAGRKTVARAFGGLRP